MASIQNSHATEVKALRDIIISQAHAVYGHQYQRHCTFSVLLSNRGDDCVAQLIVYIVPGSFSEFEVLIEGRDGPNAHHTKYTSSFYRALDALNMKMQVEVDTKIPYLSVGQSWDGTNIT